nr:PREDICTED: uncharacterized protein LOC102359915 [Latimeria chalumnae]|eukprot:XP_006009340.1 PREDICTED: uncharacterized protein LOC102359915 [Latimeria chalumnae]
MSTPSNNVWISFLILSVIFGTVTSVYKLNSIEELRAQTQNSLGKPPPAHSFALLWWFVNYGTDVNNNAQVILTFDPNVGAYGFHKFRSHDYCSPLEMTQHDLLYSAVGNLNTGIHSGTSDLPGIVRLYFDILSYYDRDWLLSYGNKERLIISYTNHVGRSILNHLYITDCYHFYCAFEISTSLMQEIRNYHLQIFLSLVGYQKATYYCTGFERQNSVQRSTQQECEAISKDLSNIKISIGADSLGHAVLIWENIPWKNHSGWFGLYQKSKDEDKQYLKYGYTYGKQSGHLITRNKIHPRMQIQYFKTDDTKNKVYAGSELSGSCATGPTPIQDLGPGKVFLQLTFNHGRASAKLYIKKDYTNWKKELVNVWVGLYEFSHANDRDYCTHQYVIKFKKVFNIPEYKYDYNYDVYEDGELWNAPTIAFNVQA